MAEASRALSVLIGRERRSQLVERLAERAGVDLSAAASWLIVRLHENPAADIPAAGRRVRRPARRWRSAGWPSCWTGGLITVTENENGSQSSCADPDARGRGDRRSA